MMKLAILGVSGSVGEQVIEVLRKRNDYELVAISVWNNTQIIDDLIKEFPTIKYVCSSSKYKSNNELVNFYFGQEGIINLIKDSKCDYVLNSISGFAGVLPSLEVLKENKTLLLANKETLVCAGNIVNNYLKNGFGNLIPIDSEHVAIKKCLYNQDVNEVKKIVITASGGKFFNLSRKELSNVSYSDAITNPNWKMGKRITIDSNTMCNKTFELIEAFHLFNIDFKKIRALQVGGSLVHGFVIYKYKNRLNYSKPTMLDPITYALDLGLPKGNDFEDVKLNELKKFKFNKISTSRFPLLKLAKYCVNGSSAGLALNAIDEVCVDYYLKKKINFKDIDEIIFKIFKNNKYKDELKEEDLLKLDKEYRKRAIKYIEENYL